MCDGPFASPTLAKTTLGGVRIAMILGYDSDRVDEIEKSSDIDSKFNRLALSNMASNDFGMETLDP